MSSRTLLEELNSVELKTMSLNTDKATVSVAVFGKFGPPKL